MGRCGRGRLIQKLLKRNVVERRAGRLPPPVDGEGENPKQGAVGEFLGNLHLARTLAVGRRLQRDRRLHVVRETTPSHTSQRHDGDRMNRLQSPFVGEREDDVHLVGARGAHLHIVLQAPVILRRTERKKDRPTVAGHEHRGRDHCQTLRHA